MRVYASGHRGAGIQPFLRQAGYRVHNVLLILRVGHAVPLVMGGSDGHAGPSGLHFRVHGHGQKIFGFLGILGQLLPQEHGKALFQRGHHGIRESPHIHADHRIRLQTGIGVQVFGHQRPIGAADNVRALGQGGQAACFIHFAHAPGNVAVFAEGVLEQIPHHGHVALVLQMGQVIISQPESLRTVKIVGVDGAERRVHQLPGGQHRVAVPQGFLRPSGMEKPCGRSSIS